MATKAPVKTSVRRSKAAPRPRAAEAGAAPARPAGRSNAAFARFTAAQRAELVAERAVYLQQAVSLKAEADLLAAEREPGDVQFDEESGEGDTMAVERQRDLALSAQAREAVDEIDVALAKIDAGTYGVCDQCGTEIPEDRLVAIPFAALCVQCKSQGFGRR